MSRATRSFALAATLLCFTAMAQAGPDWLPDTSRARSTSSSLLGSTFGGGSSLLRLRIESAGAPSAFAKSAAAASIDTDARLAGAPVAKASEPSVLEQLAFETTLEGQLAARAPVPELHPVWRAIADLYRERGNRPLWRDGDHWSTAARSALGRIAVARDDALSLPPLAPQVSSRARPR